MASKKITKLLKTKALLGASHKDGGGEVGGNLEKECWGGRVKYLENSSQRDSQFYYVQSNKDSMAAHVPCSALEQTTNWKNGAQS